MLNRFNGLFHHSIISSNNQHNNVSNHSTTSSHCWESSMSRCVKESYSFTWCEFHCATSMKIETASSAVTYNWQFSKLVYSYLNLIFRLQLLPSPLCCSSMASLPIKPWVTMCHTYISCHFTKVTIFIPVLLHDISLNDSHN